jgi:predicted transcriptional regulator
MACINPDGTPSPSAKALLKILDRQLTAEEIAKGLGQPLFVIRSSLREMVGSGLISMQENKYTITDAGKSML